MAAVKGSEALVGLFQAHPSLCSDQIYVTSFKPRALAVSSTSSKATTHVDITSRGRSPCGQYDRARILETSLRRSSLPAYPTRVSPSASGSESVSSRLSFRRMSTSSSPSSCTDSISPPSTPSSPPAYPLHPPRSPSSEPPTPNIPISPPPESGRFSGLRRIFSYGHKPTNETKSALRPLLLPNRLGLNTRNPAISTDQAASGPQTLLEKENDRLRISLSGWLPLPLPLPIPGLTSIAAKPHSASVSPTQNPSPRLRPLELGKRSASMENRDVCSVVPPSSDRANMLAWLLDCVARDIKPHWSVVPWGDVDSDERAKRMVLGNGQARCLVVRQKRRSALF